MLTQIVFLSLSYYIHGSQYHQSNKPQVCKQKPFLSLAPSPNPQRELLTSSLVHTLSESLYLYYIWAHQHMHWFVFYSIKTGLNYPYFPAAISTQIYGSNLSMSGQRPVSSPLTVTLMVVYHINTLSI